MIRDQEHRERYFDALESADGGDLGPLVDLFADVQKADLNDAIGSLRELRGETVVSVARSVAKLAKQSARERSEQSIRIMDGLASVAATRLTEVAGELRRAFANEGMEVEANAFADEGKETWWYHQIVETAKKLGYFAQLDRPKRWAALQLRLPERGAGEARLVISFHAVGRAAELHAATAFLTGRAADDKSSGWWTDVVSDRQFNFGFAGADGFVREDRAAHARREERFREWLERVVEAGVSKWGGRF